MGRERVKRGVSAVRALCPIQKFVDVPEQYRLRVWLASRQPEQTAWMKTKASLSMCSSGL